MSRKKSIITSFARHVSPGKAGIRTKYDRVLIPGKIER